MSSAYDFRPGGSLKLKGGVTEGGIKKKKKKDKSKSKIERVREDSLEVEPRRGSEERGSGSGKAGSGSASGSRHESPAASGSGGGERKTDAERRFEEVQKRRLLEKVQKMASKTHKDRVAEFNAKLESLSEHHDIPKVGPG